MQVLRKLSDWVRPRTQRRFWRYVSGRRHSVSIALFASLVILAGATWRLANPDRIRGIAEDYLEDLTNASVLIGDARLSLAEGIVLTDVQVFANKEDRAKRNALFSAAQVWLKHEPLSLLSSARFSVFEIICREPTLTLVHDPIEDRWNVSGLFQGRPASRPDDAWKLPIIRLWEGTLIRADLSTGSGQADLKESFSAVLVLSDDDCYRLQVEVGGLVGDGEVCTRTGSFFWTGRMPADAERIRRFLPQPYRGWFEAYRLSGEVVFEVCRQERGEGSAGKPSSQRADGDARPSPPDEYLDVTLDGIDLAVPDRLGGLRLSGAKGTIRLTPSGLRLGSKEKAEDVPEAAGCATAAGRVFVDGHLMARAPQFGDAEVRVAGAVIGYGSESEVNFTVTSEEVRFPLSLEGDAAEDALTAVETMLKPRGSVALRTLVHKDPKGPLGIEVVVTPKSLSMELIDFPYRMDLVSGELRCRVLGRSAAEEDGSGESGAGEALANEAGFESVIELNDLVCARGSARLSIQGTISDLSKPLPDYRLEARADDFQLDQDLRDAIPESFREIYDCFAPRGSADGDVRIYTPRDIESPEAVQTDIDVHLDGTASMEFVDFPYRVDNLVGEVRITRDRVEIEEITNQQVDGGPVVRINAGVDGLSSNRPRVSVDVKAWAVPLDAKLREALPRESREIYDQFALAGNVDVDGCFTRVGLDPVDFEVAIDFREVDLLYKPFPCPMTSTIGRLWVSPEVARVEETAPLRGSCADGVLSITGAAMSLVESDPGVELTFSAEDLNLGDEVRQALPPKVQAIWDRFQPSGPVDADLWYQATGEGETYKLLLTPRGASACFTSFPYPLRNLSGRVEAEPGVVRLQDLRAGDAPVAGRSNPGESERQAGAIRLDGELHLSQGELTGADLQISTGELAVDEEMCRALGGLVGRRAERIKPRGTLQLDGLDLLFDAASFRQGRFTSLDPSPSASSAPAEDAEAVASSPTSAQADLSPPQLRIAGVARLTDLAFDAGVPVQDVTGTVEGTLLLGPRLADVGVDAGLRLDTVEIGRGEMRGFRGRIEKAYGADVAMLRDVAADLYQGRLAGDLQVWLAPSTRYALRVNVEDVQLEELLAASADPDDEPAEGARRAVGRLDGTLRIQGEAGQPETIEGQGRLHVTEARLAQIPVVLGAMNIVFLQLPADTVFRTGRVDYYIQGSLLRFENIYMSESVEGERGNVSMVGSGEMNTEDQRISIVFVSGPPRIIPRVFGELWSITAQEVLPVRVTGTIRRPRTEAIPLMRLNELLREMGQAR